MINDSCGSPSLHPLVAGLAGMTWIFFATPLAWPWYALVGSAGTFAVGLAASYVWPWAIP